MAQFRDLMVTGVTRFINKVFASDIEASGNITANGGFTGDLTGTASNASKVNNHTVAVDVPSGAKFTDTNTTYSAGTNLSLSGTTFNHSASAAGAKSSGLYKITTDAQGHVTAATAVAKADITALGIPGSDTNTTYNDVTTSAHGLMTAADKVKLNLYGGLVVGTQTAETNVWTGELPTNVTGYTNGLTIDYLLPAKGTSTSATLNLGGKGAKPVYNGRAAAVTTHYPAKSIIHLIYTTNSNYNSGNGAWVASAYYDSNTTYSDATQSTHGLMSTADKTKLDGIATGANAYSHPTSSGNKHIPSGGSSGQILRWSADGTAAWGSDNNTTYSAATTSAAGLMSAADKTKLDGIASGANAYSLPNASSSTLGGVKIGTNISISSGTISVDGSTLINSLSEGTSNAQRDDYYVAQYAGGGTSTKTYHRRKVSALFGALNKGDITTALGYTPPTTNTTYSNMTAATASAAGKAGLVPAPAAGKQASFLRGDGTWVVPTNTTYSAATTSAAGLMSAADKTKLDGIASGATALSIGTTSTTAAAGNHTHKYAASSSAGGAATTAVGAATTTVTTSSLKNIYAGTTDMTAGTTALTTGTIYLVYE